MRRAVNGLAMLVALAAAPPVASAAPPLQETLTVTGRLQAEDREHPGSHLLALPVTRPFHDGARACASYENDVFRFPHRGWSRLRVELWRGGGRLTALEFGTRRIGGNRIDFGCRALPQLRGGDTVLYDFRFTGMPRLEPRPFSHGGFVNTSLWVTATVEPPPPLASAIELLAVEPPLGSRVPGGGRVRVRIRYTCAQPMGCNVAAGFTDNGTVGVVRGVRPGTRNRTLVLRCHDSRSDLVMGGLTVAIERSEVASRDLDVDTAAGEITCAGDGF